MNTNGSKWIRKAKRQLIYTRDGWRCVWCKTDLGPWQCGVPTLDHVIPRSEGGTNEASNLITACGVCNDSRGTLSVLQFARKLWRETSGIDFWIHVSEVLDRVIHATSAPLPQLRKQESDKAA